MVRLPRCVRSATALALCAGLCLAVLTPPPLVGQGSKPPGADTPEALLARLEAGFEAEDFGEIAACLAPEERAEMALGLLLAGGMMAAFAQMGGEMAGDMAEALGDEDEAVIEAKKQEAAAEAKKIADRFEKILADHKLDEVMESDAMSGGGPGGDDEEQVSPAELLKDVDQVALVRDIMSLLSEMGEGDVSEQAQDQLGGIVLESVEGDHATARRGDETVDLVKIDGRWFLKPEM